MMAKDAAKTTGRVQFKILKAQKAMSSITLFIFLVPTGATRALKFDKRNTTPIRHVFLAQPLKKLEVSNFPPVNFRDF